MKISTSTYYYKPKRSRSHKDFEDSELRDEIESMQKDKPYIGYRMARYYLFQSIGAWINGKRIRRIMNQYGLKARVKYKFIRTTDSNHKLTVFPNLISGKTVMDINQVWVADITYIRILTGFVFLAVILDIFSRRVIGWALSKTIDHSLTLGALKMAIAMRNPNPGLIHHSDRGVQYACEKYVSLLNENQIQISMSAKGNPYDNAFAESFFKTLKKEEVYLWEYENYLDVQERIPYFIEQVYNKKRLHSGIQYLPPETFEAMLLNKMEREKLNQINLNIY